MTIKALAVLVLLVLPALAYSAIGRQLIFFDYGDSNIPEHTGAEAILDTVAGVVKSSPGSRVEVIGHTDTAENTAISLERARNVAAALVTRGVSYDHISVTDVGDSKPLSPTAKGVREPQNRCVEIYILEKGQCG